jgi:hypothetical protein
VNNSSKGESVWETGVPSSGSMLATRSVIWVYRASRPTSCSIPCAPIFVSPSW